MTKCKYCGHELSPKVLAIHEPRCGLRYEVRKEQEELHKERVAKRMKIIEEKKEENKKPIENQDIKSDSSDKIKTTNKYSKKKKVLKK